MTTEYCATALSAIMLSIPDMEKAEFTLGELEKSYRRLLAKSNEGAGVNSTDFLVLVGFLWHSELITPLTTTVGEICTSAWGITKKGAQWCLNYLDEMQKREGSKA